MCLTERLDMAIVISRGFVITEILYRNVDQGCHSGNLKRLLLPKVMQLSKQIKKELKTAMYFILSSTSKRRTSTEDTYAPALVWNIKYQ